MRYFYIFLLFSNLLYAQEVSPLVQSFFEKLIAGDTDLSEYVLPEELNKSNRLNISYDGITNKFLISYDIDEEVKSNIKKRSLKYELSRLELKTNYSRVTFSLPDMNYQKDFYFYSDRLISPVAYYSLNWSSYESRYFRFIISDTTLFNRYSAELLDSYVGNMLGLLQVDNADRKLLEKEKILYIICKDPDEIKTITGFNTMGIYIMAYDEIITTINCHFHEVSHLLMNFKLKQLPLYTLPFLREGFASSTGGRGGIGRNIILDTGHYLHSSGFIPFNSILTYNEFFSEDASVTYPVSAIYSFYLLNTYGVNSYLSLYEKYSGDFNHVNNLEVDMISLPPVADFEKFIAGYNPRGGIMISNNEMFTTFYEGNYYKIAESENYYKFFVQKNLTLRASVPPLNYISKKFRELFPGSVYNGDKYAITANANEISIHNLYTNILISSYYSGFTAELGKVPEEEGFLVFYVDKKIFEEDIKTLTASFY
jgi:hypothetical protein